MIATSGRRVCFLAADDEDDKADGIDEDDGDVEDAMIELCFPPPLLLFSLSLSMPSLPAFASTSA